MMKKVLITTVLLIPVFALFFSCTHENLSDGFTIYDGKQLQLKSVTMYNDRPDSESGTKSEFVNGDTIGLFLNRYDHGNPFPYAVLDYYWWHLSEIVFIHDPMTVAAFYPYKYEHAYLSEKAVIVEHVTQTDYLFGKTADYFVSKEQSYADIPMYHVLALIQFRFVRNGYPHDCSVQKVSIRNADGVRLLKSRGKLYLNSGETEPLEDYYDAASVYPRDVIFHDSYTGEGGYARILVMPIEPVRNNGDILFEFEIDGRYYTWPLEAGSFWEAGKKYTYDVEMIPISRSLTYSDVPGNIRVVLTQTSKYE